MTSFGMAFKAMFARKRQGVWQVLWVTLLGALVSLIIGCIRAGIHGSFQSDILSNGELNPFASICVMLAASVAIWGMLGIFAYFFISVRQNERMNRSATWRLMPISATKFYGSNLLSAFISYVILGLIYFVIEIVLFLPIALDKHVISETGKAFRAIFSPAVWGKIDPWSVIGGIVLMLLLGIMVYAGVSLINLSSRTLADYLPTNMAKLGRFVIGFLFIILAIWLLNELGSAYNRWLLIMFEGDSELWVDNLIMFLLDAAFFGIDAWLLRDFVESK
ncbi:MAG: hypothetical protein LKG31_01335 [Lactobacillus sp.]|nr:hypothetical protein [Lactobacillus sp.]